MNANLPKRRYVISLPESERICDKCGTEMAKVRVQVSERIVHVPSYEYIEVIEKKVYECPNCVNDDVPPSQKLQATGGLLSVQLQHRNFWPMCLWVVRGGEETHPVHLYNFKWTRSGKNVLEFLDGFEGCVLQSDGYSGYDSAVDFWNENHPRQKLAH